MRSFESLSEQEILALAIGLEEEDARIFADFAQGLKTDYPATAEVFSKMREEESGHRQRLCDLYCQKYGDHIPLIRREDVRGFVKRRPTWLHKPLKLESVRRFAVSLELEIQNFYQRAVKRCGDPGVRKLLGDLAEEEASHTDLARKFEEDALPQNVRSSEAETARRNFVLRVIQPGLAGLMDGSVSTLAPVFAAAFATGKSHDAFVVGMAASLGAGISMGFAEALSDDGALTGRGAPVARGVICGLMTTVGGIGHTLPFLIQSFHAAMVLAICVVAVELAVISFVRHRYMDTPWLSATVQIVIGGVLVFITGILLGKYS